MTSTSAQSSFIKNEMKALVCLSLITVLCPRLQRLPFGFEVEDGQTEVLKGFPLGVRVCLLFERIRSFTLAFTLIKVDFLLCSQLSWLSLCRKNWNAISQESLNKALPRHMTGSVLLKSRCSSCITPLITSSPGTHHPFSWGPFQQQRLLAVLRSFTKKRLFSYWCYFPIGACQKERSHSGDCKHIRCRCQVCWKSTLLWPTGWGQEVCSGCSYLLCLPIFSLLLFVSPLMSGWLWWLSCPFKDPRDSQYLMGISFVHLCHLLPSVPMGLYKDDQIGAAFASVLPVGCAVRKSMDAYVYSLF